MIILKWTFFSVTKKKLLFFYQTNFDKTAQNVVPCNCHSKVKALESNMWPTGHLHVAHRLLGIINREEQQRGAGMLRERLLWAEFSPHTV